MANNDCKHPNKHVYIEKDGKKHWICLDCSRTDMG